MKKITFLLLFLFAATITFGQTSVDCASGPLNINYCYGNNDDTAWLFQSTDGSPLRITFNAGGIESCCDDILIYDGVDNTGTLLYVGNNGGNLAGLQFDSTGDSLYIEIDADGSVSCQSNSFCCTTEWDFTVSCANCVNPVVDYVVRQDCLNGPQFFVDVDLTDLGSATSITLSDNQGSAPQTTSATGLFSFGPFANATDVVITVTNDDDANCSLVSTAITQEFCQDFIVDCSVGPQTLNYCYSDGGAFDPVIFTFTSNDGTPLNLTFNAGVIEQGWDELVVINTDGSFIVDPAELFYGNNGDLSGLTYQSAGDTISFYINSDGIFSCQTSGYVPIDVTVACATCVSPVVDYVVRQDCLNGPQFFVDVDLTDLGSATSITLTDNQGSTPQTTAATGLFSFGPFLNNTDVVITVANDDNANCTLTSASLTQDQCVLNIVDCSAGPLNINYCYGDNDDTAWLFQSTDGSPLRITFNAGGIESCCDDILIYDGVDNTGTLLYVGNNGGNLAGLQFDSTGDSLYMEIDADGSVSCQANSFCCTTEWDFTVSCATCVNPVVDYVVRQDCLNGPQFFVDVDLTDLGSATSITLTDNQGSTPQTTAATGLFSFGPFVNNTDVVITVANDDDANCTLTSASLTQDQCVLNIVDCEVGPLNFNYCYGNNDDATWLFQSSDGSPVRLTFNAGGIESCCDDILIYEGTDNTGTLIYVGNNGGNLAGLQFDSIGDSLFMEIDADGSVSCQSNSFCCSTEWDFTVTCATCVNPAATYTVVDDCDNGDQFLIDVNITSLGDATSLTISNNIDANTVPVTAVGTYQVGPFPFLQNVIITTSNDQDVNCVINSSPIQLLACPPDNDNCDGAVVASVNDNDSCDLTTPGTIIAATPSGVPDGCAGDPDDDVWFQFTALSEVQLISITNITGGTTNLDHAVYSGSCGTLTELYCSPDAASITPELIVGNSYYIRVFSFGSIDETSSFDLCIKEAPENTVCENASSFCVEGGALYGSNVIGIPNNTSVACLGTIPNPSWNIIQIGESGPINIQMVQNTSFDDDGNPTGQGLDVDFVIWGPFDAETDYCALDLLVDCPTCPFSNNPDNGFYPFGNIIDCSYSTAPVENLTIDNAIEGEIYLLLITNFSDDPGIIQIQQTNAGGDGAGSITSEIEVNLGEDQNLCGFTEFELVADSPFADRYEWYEDGFLMDGETSSTLTVTQSNIYTVIAYDDNCEAVAQDDIIVNFYLEPTANPVADIVTCDDASADNIEDFDLEAQTAGVLGTQNPADFTVTYHLSLADAQNGVGALTSPYNNISNPQTIYVRVEDVDAVGSSSGCFATTSFDLIISGPTPTATSVDMELCDDNSRDGFESFTLTDNNANILDGQDDTQFVVSYYASEADANAGTNPLTSPYTNISNPQTIWARVESNVAFDCYSVVDFDLIVLDVPFATFNTDTVDYEVCPDATVPIEISLIPNGYTEVDVTVQWTLDTGVIPNQTGLTLPVLVEGIYEATITFNATECSYVVSETVIELESCVIPQGISPNNDGLNDSFDVSSYDVSRLEIFNRNGTLVYSKSNYSNEWFGQTNDGDELPVGTYFYSMIYQGGKEKTGWVYINR